ncbi:hypothetical protein HBHAL_4310 [Halobacillus halophilus DSM 2266]|uniref:Uncharacterized protein n=1 Tax=Halobacillus halophilus (strain ATCC 35676 / DSM 2266 / JCM 20832 / KCTC 3685 / LMG 17431 / NBRC 102448 / NCIMB 2269) TaxID=866895 RepID=I0JR81_HALH3|nr:hypothetical protein HBHAL_4310 [Halobacillus halophilus DSM 2266]
MSYLEDFVLLFLVRKEGAFKINFALQLNLNEFK